MDQPEKVLLSNHSVQYSHLLLSFGLQHSKYFKPVQKVHEASWTLNKNKTKSVTKLFSKHQTTSKHLQEQVVFEGTVYLKAQCILVISCCVSLFWRKSLDKFGSSAGTTSCPGRGFSPGSHGSTPSTGPPGICRSEQLRQGVGRGKGEI